jgi:hypothetical protein
VKRIFQALQEWAEREGGVVQWNPLSDSEGLGFWSDICLQIAAKQRVALADVLAQIKVCLSGLLQPEDLGISLGSSAQVFGDFRVTNGGGLEYRPAGIQSDLVDFLLGDCKTGLFQLGELALWVAPAFNLNLPCSSLRLLALALIQNHLAQRLKLADTRSPYGDLFSPDLEEVLNSYLESANFEWGAPAHTRYLWSQSFEREHFRSLKQNDPEANYVVLNQEWLLPASREVALEEFLKRGHARSLLLHLASPWPGRDLVPWCACFQEEANLLWSLEKTLRCLAALNTETVAEDPSDELSLLGEVGQLNHLLLCHKYRRYQAVASGAVANYLDSLRSIVRLGQRYMFEANCQRSLLIKILKQDQQLFS